MAATLDDPGSSCRSTCLSSFLASWWRWMPGGLALLQLASSSAMQQPRPHSPLGYLRSSWSLCESWAAQKWLGRRNGWDCPWAWCQTGGLKVTFVAVLQGKPQSAQWVYSNLHQLNHWLKFKWIYVSGLGLQYSHYYWSFWASSTHFAPLPAHHPYIAWRSPTLPGAQGGQQESVGSDDSCRHAFATCFTAHLWLSTLVKSLLHRCRGAIGLCQKSIILTQTLNTNESNR